MACGFDVVVSIVVVVACEYDFVGLVLSLNLGSGTIKNES